MKPYPTYKNSSLPWLGAIPEHWETRRLKYISQIIMGQSPISDDCNMDRQGPPFLQGNAEFGDLSPTPKLYCATASKFAPMGALLLSVRAPVGAINVADQVYGIGRGLSGIIPNERNIAAPFVKYALLVTRQELLRLQTGSTYGAVSIAEVAGMTLPLPPLAEQAAIIAYLDRKTADIERFITKKRQLIALLNEQKAAIINRAVTKGLNPDAPRKASGMEWLGEVPAHWEVLPLKIVASCNDDVLGENIENDYELQYLDISGVDADFGIKQTEAMLFKNAPSRARRRVKHGDVIISTVRTYLKAIANISNPAENLIVSTGFAVLRPRLKLDSSFAGYALRASYIINEIVARSIGVSYPAITATDLIRIKMALPPVAEQRKIALHLTAETETIDKAISRIEREIELIQEYRTTLISDAVTGKIDVREAADAESAAASLTT